MHDLATLAQRQWSDYQARSPGTLFADPDVTLDLAAAYQLQDGVSKLRVESGDRIIGYKVGCTGSGTTAQFGMAGPIRGCLYESELHQSGARLNFDAYANLAIEGEMALVVDQEGRALAAFPVIELHHYVFRREPTTLVELIANNGLNAGVVLPPKDRLESRQYLTAAASLEVRISGKSVGVGPLWPLAGGAEESLRWLQEHLGDHSRALSSGALVLAGTPLGLYSVRPGDTIEVSIHGLPMTTCSIV